MKGAYFVACCCKLVTWEICARGASVWTNEAVFCCLPSNPLIFPRCFYVPHPFSSLLLC